MSIKKYICFTIPLSAAGIWIVWCVRSKGRKNPDFLSWQQFYASKYGELKARILIEQVRQNYFRLLTERALPENPILRRHTTENILPGLALYQVLRKDLDQAAALAEVDQFLRVSTLKRNRFLVLLKFLPDSFWLVKIVMGSMMKSYPPEGWDFEYIEKSQERIAFNATRCFYLNTLTAYGAPELTASFCKTDDVMAELFPPSIRFIRPRTLGRGDEICDFQYCHVK